MPLRPALHPELVPERPGLLPATPWVLSHVEWLMRKHLLGQDSFLLGPPGPLRRRIALLFCNLAHLEAEYVSISRDTTEADLKQRREVIRGEVVYVDQAAVRAARHGRVLILDGVERAERNVLPVLNNLLENREMNLDDGRFLVSPSAYDTLLRDHPKSQLDAWRLLRVSERFRVISLGVPSPPYAGSPLDPPFRSRFQVRYVGEMDDATTAAMLAEGLPDELQEKLRLLARTFAELSSPGSQPSASVPLPALPLDAIPRMSHAAARDPESVAAAARRVYPFSLDTAQQRTVAGVLTRVGFPPTPPSNSAAESRLSTDFSSVPSLGTRLHDDALHALLTSQARDICIVGPRGVGKSLLARGLADATKQQIVTVPCYKDLSSRDLLQRRVTIPASPMDGAAAAAARANAASDTSWMDAPLVRAATEGHMAVLDGVERLSPGTLSALQSLLSDRRLALPDGTLLLPADHVEQMAANGVPLTGVRAVHRDFRVVALATDELHAAGDLTKPSHARTPSAPPPPASYWLNDEAATLFEFVHVGPLSKEEEVAVVRSHAPAASPDAIDRLVNVTMALRNTGNSDGGVPTTAASKTSTLSPTLLLGGASLSTRQSIRIARKMAAGGSDSDAALHSMVSDGLLAQFMPTLARTALNELLARNGVKPSSQAGATGDASPLRVWADDNHVHVGDLKIPRYQPLPASKPLVPSITFFENVKHAEMLRAMLLDFSLGEHLLLIGNQGVGKNKLCDRMLQLLNRPREYIQLHRDSTIQSLLVQPRLEDGQLVYDDAPLVRAVKHGHVLVVDEADKAPVHVTAVLKALAENGELALPDGRLIRPAGKALLKGETDIGAYK